MNKILITGSEGGVGQFIVEKLNKYYEESQIVRVSRTNYPENLRQNLYYKGDLTDLTLCKKIFDENQITDIIHCAAIWTGFNDESEILYNNFFSLNNLLQAATSSVNKIIYLSSSAVYHNTNQLESTPIKRIPNSSYGVSKLLGEKLVKQHSQFNNTKYTIYRPFHIVSPYEKYDPGRSHITTDMCHRIISCKEVINYDDLSNKKIIPFTWGEDFADLVVSNLNNSKFDNEIFNVGNSTLLSVKDLVTEILDKAFELDLLDYKTITSSFKCPNSKQDARFRKLASIGNWSAHTQLPEFVHKFLKIKFL